jgi:hypothetical protein
MRGSEPLLVAIIALSGILISAIIGGLIAFVTSRKALYVNAVTVERSKRGSSEMPPGLTMT